MNKQNKVVNEEKKECGACGDNVYDEMYKVVCVDGEEFEACNICLISFFTEIPNEIESVKIIRGM